MRQRNVLTKTQAIEIFMLRNGKTVDTTVCLKNASSVAKRYGVSPKAVRDIWIGRTWYRETFFLEPQRADAGERLTRRIGRPKGKKDSVLRKRRDWLFPSTSYQLTTTEHGSPLRWKHSDNQEKTDDMHTSAFPDRSIKKQTIIAEANLIYAPISTEASNFGDPFHDDWHHWHPSAQPAQT